MSTASPDRTRIRRQPELAQTDPKVLHAILDAGLVAHLAVVQDGQPFVLPVGYARRDDEVLFHGSTASRLFRLLEQGQPTCLTVTLLDGLVLARSTFESSMNYRSAVVLGVARRLSGDDELDALRCITEHLLPGRWSQARHPNAKERAATMTLALPLTEWSVKTREGEPEDLPADLVDPALREIWAGHVPLNERFGSPIPDVLATELNTPVPPYIGAWMR